VEANALAGNYAELLLNCGYVATVNLQIIVGEWLALLNEFKPDLLVIDHSPTVLLSNKITNIPIIQIGAGFEMPTIEAWQAFFPTNVSQQKRLRSFELTLLNNMNMVLQAYAGPLMKANASLFQGCEQLLTTYEELDHYERRTSGARYVGPILSPISGDDVAWEVGQYKKILLYLWPQMPGLNQLLNLLGEMPVEVVAVVPGINESAKRKFSKDHLRIFNHTINLTNFAVESDLLITHGFGTINIFLLHGVPVLVVPKTLEHILLGSCIEKNGYGLMMKEQRGRRHFEHVLQHLISEPVYRDNARNFANKYQHVSNQDALEVITSEINTNLSI
jgi:hypothetical protein